MTDIRIPGATTSAAARATLRHVRAPEPIVFPEEEEVPEGLLHLITRTFLYRLLSHLLGPGHSVGSDQFVYWIATEPRRKLAPDVFVRLGVPQTEFGSWKTWEQGGVPDLAVEIVSPNEGDGVMWEEKLARYHELGVAELVRFEPEAEEGRRVRVWDRVRQDLVERVIEGDRTPCLLLGLGWAVRAIPASSGNLVPVLRLIDEAGNLAHTPEEEQARARVAADARADAEAKARAAAEERVRQLEEELRRRGG